ncbi:MAG: hypothetical protein ACP6IQ_01940 [Candidatus Njordarchaeia archaeon]
MRIGRHKTFKDIIVPVIKSVREEASIDSNNWDFGFNLIIGNSKSEDSRFFLWKDFTVFNDLAKQISDFVNTPLPGDKVLWQYDHWVGRGYTLITKKGEFIREVVSKGKELGYPKYCIVHFKGNKNPSKVPVKHVCLEKKLKSEMLLTSWSRHLENLNNFRQIQAGKISFLKIVCIGCGEVRVSISPSSIVTTESCEGIMATITCHKCNYGWKLSKPKGKYKIEYFYRRTIC